MVMSHLPSDHPLGRVYRVGGGLTGVVILVFGILGFFNKLDFFSTHGKEVAGLSSNGLLSLISVVVGVILLGGALVGGNVAAVVNLVIGLLFLGSGMFNLALLRTPVNFLAFRMPNVIFSFVVGLLLLGFGMYGRVGGGLGEPAMRVPREQVSAAGGQPPAARAE